MLRLFRLSVRSRICARGPWPHYWEEAQQELGEHEPSQFGGSALDGPMWKGTIEEQFNKLVPKL